MAGFFQAAIVLADVDAVGSEFAGEGGVVVEDEGDACGAAERDEEFRDAADGGEVVILGAELEDVRAAGQQRGGDGGGVFRGHVAEVEDGVEAKFFHKPYRSHRSYGPNAKRALPKTSRPSRCRRCR